MDITIESDRVHAVVQLQGAMTTAIFDAGTDHEFSPSYVAPWERFTDVPLLDKLRGDFLCVPFGAAPAAADDLPLPWRAGYAGPQEWVHGFSSNGRWSVIERSDASVLLSLDYAQTDPVARVERRVTCTDDGVEFEDAIVMRSDARLPIGLHPILRLPGTVGGARLEMPECDEFWTLPLDSGTSVLQVGARFSDLTSAPRADGSSIDLSRLPPTDEVDEIILVAGPKTPRISLINESEDYRATIEWDSAFLKNALLWISNRGRKGAPWGGENLCLGIEPITSAFDFGTGVSASPNPLTAAGYDTAIDLKAGEYCTIRHRMTAQRL